MLNLLLPGTQLQSRYCGRASSDDEIGFDMQLASAIPLSTEPNSERSVTPLFRAEMFSGRNKGDLGTIRMTRQVLSAPFSPVCLGAPVVVVVVACQVATLRVA